MLPTLLLFAACLLQVETTGRGVLLLPPLRVLAASAHTQRCVPSIRLVLSAQEQHKQ